MNRTILILICDFLLVSLLAFSTVDINRLGEDNERPATKLDLFATNQVESGKDLAGVMRVALEDERRNRDRLLGELARTREDLQGQQEQLATRQKQVETFKQEMLTKEQQAALLQQEQTNLQEKLNAAQGSLQTLGQQLHATATEATVSKERLAAMEAELRKQAEQAAAFQQQMTVLAQSNQVVLAQKQQIAAQLQVAEVERRHATEQAAKLEDQVKVEREEKSKLAEGVKVLATKSTDLEREIRENRPLAPNTIYSDFLSNRVEAQFTASRSTLLGGGNKHRATQTVIASDGTNTYALCHVQDTPFTFWNPGTEWEGLSGTLNRGKIGIPIRSVSFGLQDPRIVLIPIGNAEAKQLGGKIYTVSTDPFKFQDAVLVGEGYYGECRFEIDASTPGYLKLDNNFLKGIFGKFNPSRGDLVFSRTGELLGVMANPNYCMRTQKFESAATFRFGPDVRAQRTGVILSLLYSTVAELPFKLQ